MHNKRKTFGASNSNPAVKMLPSSYHEMAFISPLLSIVSLSLNSNIRCKSFSRFRKKSNANTFYETAFENRKTKSTNKLRRMLSLKNKENKNRSFSSFIQYNFTYNSTGRIFQSILISENQKQFHKHHRPGHTCSLY